MGKLNVKGMSILKLMQLQSNFGMNEEKIGISPRIVNIKKSILTWMAFITFCFQERDSHYYNEYEF